MRSRFCIDGGVETKEACTNEIILIYGSCGSVREEVRSVSSGLHDDGSEVCGVESRPGSSAGEVGP